MSSTSDPRSGSGDDIETQGGRIWHRRAVRIGMLALTGVIGAILLLTLSPNGVHASNDSFTYLGAASNLTRGEGWTYPFGDLDAPVTLFPPLYPVLMAIPDVLGVAWFDWVIWQNAILLGAFAFAVGLVVADATQGRAIPAVIAAFLVLLGTPTVVAYSHIWSETLFFPMVILILAAVARYVTTRRTRTIVVAAALTSLAMLTRYAGLSIFVTVCLLLLVWPGSRILDRSRVTALYAAIALPLSALWSLRNLAVSDTLTGDNRLIHDLDVADVAEGLVRMWQWFLPDRPVGAGHDVLVGAATFAVAFLLIFLTRLGFRARSIRVITIAPIVSVCVSFALVHFSFIAVANAFSTRAPPFNDRILGPAFAPLVVVIVVLGQAIWLVTARRRIPQAMVIGAAASLVVLAVIAATDAMPAFYGSRVNTAPEYREFARTLDGLIPPRSALFSTRPNVAWFVLRRPVSSLPRSCKGGRELPNPSFRRELADLDDRLGERRRTVIIFRRSKECAPFSIAALNESLRLTQISPKGLVWVLWGPFVPTGTAAMDLEALRATVG